ncbi:MAG: hypothetical protein OXF02_00410 [Simkaniaceae bacterium]|nr:hypothetical protein [Simkaniaceae bacterium]
MLPGHFYRNGTDRTVVAFPVPASPYPRDVPPASLLASPIRGRIDPPGYAIARELCARDMTLQSVRTRYGTIAGVRI